MQAQTRLRPITDRLQKLDDRVYEAISQAIIAGELQPGERLREAEVGDALGVSRTPVRAALARLEREHLVQTELSGAYRVAVWDTRTLWEVATLRAALESLAITLAAKHLTAEDYDRLDAIVREMQAAAQRGDRPRLVVLDTEFHTALWARCEHRLLVDALEAMRPQIRYFVRVTAPPAEHYYVSMHQELIDILRGADPDEQRRVMEEHILIGARLSISRLEESGATGIDPGEVAT